MAKFKDKFHEGVIGVLPHDLQLVAGMFLCSTIMLIIFIIEQIKSTRILDVVG